MVNDKGIQFSPITSGAIVDEHRQTCVEGVFACGNVLHVHDLVDNVSEEGTIAGASAADYAMGKLAMGNKIPVLAKDGVRYALPHYIYEGEDKVRVYFRVGQVYKNATLIATSGGEKVFSKKYMILAPGEMGFVLLDKSKLKESVTLSLEV